MITKSYVKGSNTVLAVCDENLLGKIFEEGGVVLDLKTYRSFYEGEKTSEDKLIELANNASSINAIGSGALVLADRGICPKGSIRYIKGIPHIQIYRV